MHKNQRNVVLFDLDGTLLNTLADLTASVNYALRKNKFSEREPGEIRRFLGNGIRYLMQCAVPQGTTDAAFEQTFQDFRTYYLEHCLDKTEPYAGIKPLLKELLARGYQLAIVSNKLQPAVTELRERFFKQELSVAIGESQYVQRKPAPDTILTALKELGADTSSAVYVGDSEVDIETARRAGVPCISVLWGFRDLDFLKAHQATRFAESPQDILSILQQDNL